MSNFFLAVGGTGQMAALSYCRLLGLMPWLKSEDTKIYDMDMDPVKGFKDLVKSTHISPLPDAHGADFKAHFIDPAHSRLCKDILSTLYTSKELDTDITTGMYGHPPVGSAIIMHMLRRGPQEISQLLNNLDDGNPHTVVICGSSMGGTGAGGVPSLARYIDQYLQLSKTGHNNRGKVKIYVLYFLQYFNLSLGGKGDANQTITNKAISTNAESGMCYFKEEIAKGTEGCLLLGYDRLPTRTYEVVNSQTEQPHPFFVLTSLYTHHAFMSQDNIFGNHLISTHTIDLDEDEQIVGNMGIRVDLGEEKEVGLDSLIQLNMYARDLLRILGMFVSTPPVFAFVPAFPPELDAALNRLRSMKNVEIAEVQCDLAEAIDQRVVDLSRRLEWYEEVLTPGVPFRLMEFPVLSEKRYFKITAKPMSFIRRWFRKVGKVSLGGTDGDKECDKLVAEILPALYRTLDSTFLNGAFFGK